MYTFYTAKNGCIDSIHQFSTQYSEDTPIVNKVVPANTTSYL